MRLGMIADDLTGACDAGVQFAARGFSAQVWINTDVVPGAAEMTIVSTGTRKEPAARARAKVVEACAALIGGGVEIVYKKIDSTLLGNIGPELEAALDTCRLDEAWVAPSFPAMGRTVSGGWLQVAGCKPTVHLPTLLKEQGAGRARAFDAKTQPELAAIVRAARKSRKRVLLAGSAGLAIELAAELAARFGKKPRPSRPPKRATGPVVFLIGSVNPVTAAQVRFLLRRRTAVAGLEFAANALASGRHSVVQIAWQAGELACLPDLIRSYGVRGLVFSGGDTARLACWVLQAAGIRLDREILTGIPCGTLAGGLFDGLPVATKAGGFGGPDALALIADSMTT